MATFKKNIKNKIRQTLFLTKRKRLKNHDFTIISNNCWGGNVSTDFNIQHQSPFVGMFIMSEDYLKLCENLDYYMKQELKFIEISKWDNINERRKTEHYPLAVLGDVELNMQHYKNKDEVLSKWNRRRERINWDNLYFKFEENYGATPEMLATFDNLPYDNKIIFTEQNYLHLKSAVHFTNFDLKSRMEHYTRFFDITEWLNTGKIVRR